MKFQLILPQDLRGALDASVSDWTSKGNVERLFQKDATLWTGTDEAKWLGWTDIVARQHADLAKYAGLAADIHASGIESLLVLGMGGSSLCPEVLSVTFGQQRGYPAPYIVDSTNPAQVKEIRDKVDLCKALVIVASKSGSTLEPNVLKQYFFEEMKKAVGAENAGGRFIAITDPGSKMQKVAEADGFRHVFFGDPQVGGRFSALSPFGVVPATAMGLDTYKLLDEAGKAVEAAKRTPADNPAVQLGLLLGTAANAGRDKITVFTSPEVYDLGAWLEQLIAESTGKLGKGITPVDREQIAAPDAYGSDRIFAYIRFAGTKDASQDAAVAALEAAGQPVIRIEIADLYEIFSQFFTWEVATAVAGAVMGVNPFDQPDVESAKIVARELTNAYEQTGKLPSSQPVYSGEGVEIYATEAYAAKLAVTDASLTSWLRAHLNQIVPGDYFAALAYLPMVAENEAAIQQFRHKVRDAKKVATCLGFGPRFLHSTGQDYKGGPNTGVFLHITSDHSADLAIPDQKFTFGVCIDAQAGGDLSVLEERGRRVLRIHLHNVESGLKALGEAVAKAL